MPLHSPAPSGNSADIAERQVEAEFGLIVSMCIL
jgi:hypothetical protein